jgi:hypothetical protein
LTIRPAASAYCSHRAVSRELLSLRASGAAREVASVAELWGSPSCRWAHATRRSTVTEIVTSCVLPCRSGLSIAPLQNRIAIE